MKTIFKTLALASAPLAIAAVSIAPAQAQSKLGIAVVNMDRAALEGSAYKTAVEQMKVTYKSNIDSVNTRQTALDAELKQKGATFQAAVKAAGGKSTPALQAQYEALQKRAQEAQAELQRLNQPIAIADSYVKAQIAAKMDAALKTAMTQTKVDLVIKEDATEGYQPGVDITSAVTAALNAVVPSVGIVPPAGWQPGQPLPGAAAPAGQAAGGR